MGKEILTYGDIETEKNKLLATIILLFFKKDVDIEKVLVCNKISIGENIVNISLVTCIMIIKLSHYI